MAKAKKREEEEIRYATPQYLVKLARERNPGMNAAELVEEILDSYVVTANMADRSSWLESRI